jgi:hypothetical protein
MKRVRDVAMWMVAIVLFGPQAKMAVDGHSAMWSGTIPAIQELASNRASQNGFAAHVAARSAAEGQRERLASRPDAFHFETLYWWHRQATRLP